LNSYISRTNLQKSFGYLVNDWFGGQGEGISTTKPVLGKGTNGWQQ